MSTETRPALTCTAAASAVIVAPAFRGLDEVDLCAALELRGELPTLADTKLAQDERAVGCRIARTLLFPSRFNTCTA